MVLPVSGSQCFWHATKKCDASSFFFQWNVWPGGKQTIYAYADDYTLLVVVLKPADRPVVAIFLNRDLARIQEWRNYLCMIMNPNKTKASVVSRSRIVTLPFVTRSCLELPFTLVSTSVFLAWSLTESSPSKTMYTWYCLLCLSKNWYFQDGDACLCEHLSVASLLLCICSTNPSVLVSGVVGLLLNVIFTLSRARCIRWPGFALIK